MQIPEVRVDAILKLIAQQLVGTITIAQVGPGVDALAHAPTGALIGAEVHRHTGSRKPLRSIRRNQGSREQAEHMGHVTMTKALAQRIAVRVLVEGFLGVPLLDLAIGADLDRSAQVIKFFLPHGQNLGVLAYDLASLDSIVEQLPDERLLIGIAGGTRTVLGRIRGRRNILAVAIADEQLGIQLCLLAERGVNIALQILYVACVAIGVIGVLENPRHGRGRPAPVEAPARAGPAKGRILRMGHKAVGLALGAFDAGIDFGGHTTRLTQAINIGDERLSRLRKVCGVDRPIVHLQVDVHVIVGSPRRIHEVVPHALQIAGELRVLTRRRNSQITAVLIKHGLEQAALGLGSGTVVVGLEQLIGRFVRSGGIAQAQIDTAHKRTHVGNVIGANGVIALVGGSICRSLYACMQLLGRLARAICRIVILVIRCRGNEEGNLACARNDELVTRCRNGTALGVNLQNGIVLELVVGDSARKRELVSRSNGLATLFGGERDLDVHRVALRGKLTGDHVVGVAGNELTIIGRIALLKGNVSKTVLDVERTLVLSRTRIRETIGLKVDIAPGLIRAVAILRSHQLVAQVGGLVALALGKELLDVLEGLTVVALVFEVATLIVRARRARTTRPEGLLVKGKVLGSNLAIYVGTHVAVTDGQRTFLPDVIGVAAMCAGRFSIPEL